MLNVGRRDLAKFASLAHASSIDTILFGDLLHPSHTDPTPCPTFCPGVIEQLLLIAAMDSFNNEFSSHLRLFSFRIRVRFGSISERGGGTLNRLGRRCGTSTPAQKVAYLIPWTNENNHETHFAILKRE